MKPYLGGTFSRYRGPVDNLLEARVVIGNWLVEYNTLRPHRGLGMLTPAAYAASIKKGPR